MGKLFNAPPDTVQVISEVVVIMGLETIKQQATNGCMAAIHELGLWLVGTPPLSVMHSIASAAVCTSFAM